jgi:hypothetical protein
MHPETREFREENRFLASVAERVLRADPLLQPYFEDGVFGMTDRPEEEFMSFDPALSDQTRQFIRERVREVLSQKPPPGDEAAEWLWEEREKVRRELETDPELFPVILAGTLAIQNSAEGFKIEIDPGVPDDEAASLNDRLTQVLALHFGIIPRPE